jgi:hypothetical protein
MHLFSYRENATPIWVPCIGQKFTNLDNAWSFWVDRLWGLYMQVLRSENGTQIKVVKKCDKKVTSFNLDTRQGCQ